MWYISALLDKSETIVCSWENNENHDKLTWNLKKILDICFADAALHLAWTKPIYKYIIKLCVYILK